eukprot:scaffold17595_cov61-Phaeocystis_antarctica.AAC.9
MEAVVVVAAAAPVSASAAKEAEVEVEVEADAETKELRGAVWSATRGAAPEASAAAIPVASEGVDVRAPRRHGCTDEDGRLRANALLDARELIEALAAPLQTHETLQAGRADELREQAVEVHAANVHEPGHVLQVCLVQLVGCDVEVRRHAVAVLLLQCLPGVEQLRGHLFGRPHGEHVVAVPPSPMDRYKGVGPERGVDVAVHGRLERSGPPKASEGTKHGVDAPRKRRDRRVRLEEQAVSDERRHLSSPDLGELEVAQLRQRRHAIVVEARGAARLRPRLLSALVQPLWKLPSLGLGRRDDRGGVVRVVQRRGHAPFAGLAHLGASTDARLPLGHKCVRLDAP